MTDFQGVREAVAAVRSRGLGSVVGIGSRPPFGTGVVVGQSRVVTSAHNVRWDHRLMHFADGSSRRAEATVRDWARDLAVITVDTADVAAATFADSAPGLGEPVLAAARPGPRALRLTIGYVSSVGPGGGDDEGFEHSAPLPRGSSGGPAFNASGEVAGLNTRRLGEGFYWALPAGPDLNRRLAELLEGRVAQAGWLGLALLPPEMAGRLREAVGLSARPGALIREVVPGGPAASAGLLRGDLLVGLDGRAIANRQDLRAALGALTPGSSSRVQLVRGTDELEVELTAGAPPEDQPRHRPGPGRGRHHGRG